MELGKQQEALGYKFSISEVTHHSVNEQIKMATDHPPANLEYIRSIGQPERVRNHWKKENVRIET